MNETVLIPIHDLQNFVIRTLQSVVMSDADAAVTAAALVTADAMGVSTHGTKLLAGYLKRLHGGGYSAKARPEVEREGPGWGVVNGHSGLGQVGCQFAIELAISKAQKVGIAYVGLKNTGHIGAAGYYAAIAARQGFIAMVTGNDMPSVAVPGSRKAVLGSNPIAYAVPVPGKDPILLDIATAAVAGGKVYAAIQRGEEIPATWLIGPDGHPTTDGTLYPHQAALAPMAGHKGYGFGLWCEILSGVLCGGEITWQIGSWIFDEPSRPSRHNAGFIVMHTDTIADRADYDSRLQQLIAEIHSAEPADGCDRVLLPGEREWQLWHAAQLDGVQLPPDVVAKLSEAAEFTGCEVPDGINKLGDG